MSKCNLSKLALVNKKVAGKEKKRGAEACACQAMCSGAPPLDLGFFLCKLGIVTLPGSRGTVVRIQ